MNLLGIKNILSRKFRGVNLDDVQGISNYSVFGEAASNLTSKIDPIETIRHGSINIFDGIYDYTSPTDLKGKKIADIRPQVNRSSTHDVSQTFLEDFDRDKESLKFSVEFNDGTKFIRYNDPVGNSIVVTDVSATTSWAASAGGANLAIDTILFAENSSSLRFDVGVTGGIVTYTPSTGVDLSTHTQKSSFFMWVYLPDSSILTSLKIRVGSSITNYYEITGSIHFGSIRNGWNLYRFDWNGVSDSGTTDESAIDYVRVALVTTSADTDIRIGSLSSKLPKPEEFVYYSDSLFRPVSGSTWLTIPTLDTNIVNLENEALNIFIYECCSIISDDMQTYDDSVKFRSKLIGEGGLYDDYKKNKPGEEIRSQSTWYDMHGIRQGRRFLKRNF